MVKDHEEDKALFEKAVKKAKCNDVKKFAEATLPTLKKHLQGWTDILAKYYQAVSGVVP